MTRRHDPETGCALIMFGSAVASFAMYVALFILAGWRGPVLLLIASLAAIAVLLMLAEDDR